MATKRDLVEAHAFSRRRLVTAFVSGAPGGREVEPSRPGRTLVGGAALAVLLAAGALIAGVFVPRAPADWRNPGLVVSRDGLYVITEESDPTVVRPVLNVTSARLILGSDEVEHPVTVPQDEIDRQQVEEDIGILGAPRDVPAPDRLIDTGWTACTTPGGGVRLTVSASPQVRDAPSGGLVVRNRGAYYLVAEGGSTTAQPVGTHRYRLPGQSGIRDNVLTAIGLPASVYAADVSDEWLALFPEGGALAATSMGVAGAGDPDPLAGGPSGIPAGARIGDVVDDGLAPLLLTRDGPAQLDEFAMAVYLQLPGRYVPALLETDQAVTAGRARAPYASAGWPTTLLDAVPGELCARLDATVGAAPVVHLATDPGEAASAVGVAAGARAVRVDEGAGAYVLSGSWDDASRGAPFVVDARGRAYPLVGSDAPELLGYADVPAPVVPDSWVQLFDAGVPLSRDAALCSPYSSAGDECG